MEYSECCIYHLYIIQSLGLPMFRVSVWLIDPSKQSNQYSLSVLPCGKNINNDTWNTPGEMLQWYIYAFVEFHIFLSHIKIP